ncbi:MAG: glycosyltransferase family 2 protein [Flavobacteriaceae bacterium]
MADKTFSILITTKNRLNELSFTLQKITYLLEREDVECIICDDGSNDGTYDYIVKQYPDIEIFKNQSSKGLIYSRNRLLKKTKAQYAISLDDDLHFITENPLKHIETFFKQNPTCAVMTFRIYWNLEPPVSTAHHRKIERVNSFAGGAHAWRMEDWKTIPDYPEWFMFYGEEEFASFNLFKAQKHIYYYPDILCHHRVNLNMRKKEKDYIFRQRRSLRSGWYLYLMFYPLKYVPRKFAYSIWMQLKTKVFKGDMRMLMAIFLSFSDIFCNSIRLSKNCNRLSVKEFKEYSKLQNVILYWKPD